MSPKLSTSILSIPFGPRALFTDSATICAAMMLACWASCPLDRDAPSRSMRTGVPANPEDNLNQFSLFCFGTLENAFRYKDFSAVR
jgi:hypothetical protein